VDEVLPLSRELADQSRPEILPDSELDDEVEDAAIASVASGGAACFPWFDDDPPSSTVFETAKGSCADRNGGIMLGIMDQ
jgi:hypothetical protein